MKVPEQIYSDEFGCELLIPQTNDNGIPAYTTHGFISDDKNTHLCLPVDPLRKDLSTATTNLTQALGLPINQDVLGIAPENMELRMIQFGHNYRIFRVNNKNNPTQNGSVIAVPRSSADNYQIRDDFEGLSALKERRDSMLTPDGYACFDVLQPQGILRDDNGFEALVTPYIPDRFEMGVMEVGVGCTIFCKIVPPLARTSDDKLSQLQVIGDLTRQYFHRYPLKLVKTEQSHVESIDLSETNTDILNQLIADQNQVSRISILQYLLSAITPTFIAQAPLISAGDFLSSVDGKSALLTTIRGGIRNRALPDGLAPGKFQNEIYLREEVDPSTETLFRPFHHLFSNNNAAKLLGVLNFNQQVTDIINRLVQPEYQELCRQILPVSHPSEQYPKRKA